MATYVNNLRLTELATGEGSGTWGTTTNTSLELIGEALGFNTQNCFSSDADATTTVADGATDPARAFYFKVTSSATLTATRTLTIAPNTVSRVMFIENATTGSQSITISQGSGANVTIATGKTAVVYLDGAGSGAAVVDAMAGVDPGVTDTLAEVLAAGNTTGGTNIVFGDSSGASDDRLVFGAGSDLQIYHDGSDSYIQDSGAGDLRLKSNGSGVKIEDAGNTLAFFDTANNNAKLYHNSNQKLETLGTGIDVTGKVVSDGLDTSEDLIIRHSTTDHLQSILGTDGGGFAIEDNNYFAIWHQDIANVGTDNGLTERLRVDSSGNLLVNGTNATGKLVVDGAANAYTARFNSSTTTGQAFGLRVRAGTNSSDFAALVENTSATTMFAVRGDGNVGIGTSSPEETLSVMGDFQVALNTSVTGRGLKVSTSNSSITDDLVTFNAQASTGILAFQTNSSERLRIDASGNLLVGKSVTSLLTAGIALNSNGAIYATVDSERCLILNRETSNGSIAEFRKDNSTVGTIGVDSGDNFFISASAANHAGLYLSTNLYAPLSAGSLTDDAISLGNSAYRYKDLHLSNSIQNASGALAVISGGGAQLLLKASSELTFTTNAAERARIDTSGNLLVGATTTTNLSDGTGNDGVQLNPSGTIAAARTSNVTAVFNRLSSDGEIARFNKDGTTVGAIGVINSDNLRIGGSVADHAGLQFALHEIVPMEANVDSDGTINLGSTNSKFKDLHLSGDVIAPNIVVSNGVFVGGTSNANKLDDYEEGTFTPSFNGGDYTFTYNKQKGSYTKIGNRVFVDMMLNIDASTAPSGSTDGNLFVAGLPFTFNAQNSVDILAVSIGFKQEILNAEDSLSIRFVSGNTQFSIHKDLSTGFPDTTLLQASDLAANSRLRIQFSYPTNS